MVTQGLWQRDPVLMQLPHFTRELATACTEKGAFTIMPARQPGLAARLPCAACRSVAWVAAAHCLGLPARLWPLLRVPCRRCHLASLPFSVPAPLQPPPCRRRLLTPGRPPLDSPWQAWRLCLT